MNDTNPKTASDAILAGDKVIDGVQVYPMSIARYALLELTKSPFVTAQSDFSISNLITTFYIMCNPSSELKGYNSKNMDVLFEKAVEWSENFKIDVTSKLIDAIAEELGLLKKVAPQADGAAQESADGVTTKK